MKNIEWQEYGKDAQHGSKLFKVENDVITLSWNNSFSMDVNNFLVCCANTDDIPLTDEHATSELPVGEDNGRTVSMSLTNNHDNGSEVQMGITLRDGGKWDSWARFTIPELESIVSIVRKYQ